MWVCWRSRDPAILHAQTCTVRLAVPPLFQTVWCSVFSSRHKLDSAHMGCSLVAKHPKNGFALGRSLQLSGPYTLHTWRHLTPTLGSRHSKGPNAGHHVHNALPWLEAVRQAPVLLLQPRVPVHLQQPAAHFGRVGAGLACGSAWKGHTSRLPRQAGSRSWLASRVR